MKRHTDERTTPHTQVRKFQKEEQREIKSKKRGARSFPHKMKTVMSSDGRCESNHSRAAT